MSLPESTVFHKKLQPPAQLRHLRLDPIEHQIAAKSIGLRIKDPYLNVDGHRLSPLKRVDSFRSIVDIFH